MKIGFVSIDNAARLTPASLHSYFEAKALADQGLELRFLGPLTLKRTPFLLLRRTFSRFLRGNRFLPSREPAVVTDLASQISVKLHQTPVDVIFSHGTIPVSQLDCPVPIVFWSDATFAGMVDFYPGFTHLDPASLEHGNQLEQSTLERAALAFFSSAWAAKTCLENYRIDPAKVKVVPFGSNLLQEPPLLEVARLLRARPNLPCRLVFVGAEWGRKGGDLALGLAEALHCSGLPIELDLIGCRPSPKIRLPDYVRVIGYIDTSTPTGQKDYLAQLAQAHFLVLPTRADCSPRVLYEAGAMGLPSLTTNVGGIASIIQTGVNGGLFPLGDGFVEGAAQYVLEAVRTPVGYQELALRTIEFHSQYHTWGRSGREILAWLEGITANS